MKPIFGLQFGSFPIYWLMILQGCFVGMFVFNGIIKKFEISKYVKRRVRRSLFLGALCGLLSSNIIHWLIYKDVRQMPVVERFLQGGYSVYFGVLGFLGVSALLLRLYRISVYKNLNMAIIPLIISQIIWRTGCALRGCCYGVGENFEFPVRFFEMLGLLGLAIFLHLYKNNKQRISIYLFGYSLLRFVLEFFRGDDRGELFGINLLTPTQIVALVVILLSGACLFICPILEKNKKGVFSKKEKAPYIPLPQDYVETNTKNRALKIISLITVIAIFFTSVLAIWNPLSANFLDGFSDSVKSWLYDERGKDTPIGDSTSTSVINLSYNGKIDSDETALKLISSYDQFANVSLTAVKPLTDNERVYVFEQTVDGKSIVGTECVLVTDYDGNAKYIVSDAANRAYAKNVVSKNPRTLVQTSDVSFDGYTEIYNKEAFYNTGEGLLDVIVKKFTKNGKDVDFGAVIEKGSGMVISLTDADGKMTNAIDRICIIMSTARVSQLLDDPDEIKSLSKKAAKGQGSELKFNTLCRALAQAYVRSDLSEEDFKAITNNCKNIVRETSTVSINTFCDIFVKETVSYLQSKGKSEEFCNSVADKIEQAFERCGIEQKDDRVATEITARERKATFNYKMDFLEDRDLYVINGIPNQSTKITFSSKTPILVEISTNNNEARTTLFVEGEQEIDFSPEDGERFIVRVIDKRNSDEADKAASYKITVLSIKNDENRSEFVTDILDKIEKAYNTSNYSIFAAYITDSENQPYYGWQILALGIAPQLLDACSKSCMYESEYIDTAKDEILRYLIVDYPSALQIGDETPVNDVLKSTKLELNYIKEMPADNGATYVWASIGIYMDGFYLYEGNTFLQIEMLEHNNEETFSEIEIDPDATEEENRLKAIEWGLTKFLRDGYYVTKFNTDEIASAFNKTLDDTSGLTEVASLYTLWETKELINGNVRITLHTIDSEAAIAEGHSEEKVRGFEEFVYEKNMSDLYMLRSQLNYEVQSAENATTYLDLVFLGVAICGSGGWGALFWALGKVELGWTEVPFNLGQLKWWEAGEAFLGGKLQDAALGECERIAEELKNQVKIVEKWITTYETSRSLSGL